MFSAPIGEHIRGRCDTGKLIMSAGRKEPEQK
jgi:hypothetical protein